MEYICNTLGAEIVNIPFPDSNIYNSGNGYRFYPNKLESEGFLLRYYKNRRTGGR